MTNMEILHHVLKNNKENDAYNYFKNLKVDKSVLTKKYIRETNKLFHQGNQELKYIDKLFEKLKNV